MTADRPWAHLPNARHINAVLADVNTRPEVWKAVLAAARPAGRSAARVAARDAARGAARDAAWVAALGAAWVAALGAVGDVIRALVAWGEAGDLVDLPPDVLRTMADLAPEPVNHQAVLLLPWALVRAYD